MWAIAVAGAIVYIWAGLVFSAALRPASNDAPEQDWEPLDAPVKPDAELPRTH